MTERRNKRFQSFRLVIRARHLANAIRRFTCTMCLRTVLLSASTVVSSVISIAKSLAFFISSAYLPRNASFSSCSA